MGNKKKMTVLDFQKYKDEGRKFSFVTAYDYTTASIVNDSDCEIILVGDSLGMIMLGYDTTVPVTVDDMIHHIRPVVKGAPDTFIIGDMPFGSYNVSKEQAIETANRITKETLCDCVKLEGGVNMAPTIRAMVDAGINVMGHIGMTPQTATSFGGFKVQGGTPESARKLIEDAKALEAARRVRPWSSSAFPALWPRRCRKRSTCPSWASAPAPMWTARCWSPRTCWACTATSSPSSSSSSPTSARRWSRA